MPKMKKASAKQASAKQAKKIRSVFSHEKNRFTLFNLSDATGVTFKYTFDEIISALRDMEHRERNERAREYKELIRQLVELVKDSKEASQKAFDILASDEHIQCQLKDKKTFLFTWLALIKSPATMKSAYEKSRHLLNQKDLKKVVSSWLDLCETLEDVLSLQEAKDIPHRGVLSRKIAQRAVKLA